MLLLIPGVVDAATLKEVRTALDGATFVDGKTTARGSAKALKQTLQLNPSDPLGKKLGEAIVARLSAHPAFAAATLPKQVLVPMFSRYENGGHYGKHLDVPVMGRAPQQVRSDISVTVFLSDDDEYEGGELLLHVHGGTRAIKGKAGDVFVYPSTTMHEVRPVTKGQRLVAVTWIQSLVSDASRRELLYDLGRTIKGLESKEPLKAQLREEVLALRSCHYNLLRMWADA